MKTSPLISGLLLWALVAPEAPANEERGSHPEVASWLLGLGDRALADRVLDVSARFLGTPYVHSPLGEGSGVDPDPFIRFDAVDCLTFVEETLALSIARSPTEVVPLLLQLRYERTPRYEERNHLMEAQWVPNNVRKGFLRDVTREVGGPATVRARKVITRQSWASPSSRLLHLPDERHITGAFELDMLTLPLTLARAPQIPSGTILLVLRDENPRKVTRITHLGFVVQKKNRTFLRHAARGGYRRVVDEDLTSFLARHARYGKWHVCGTALLEPNLPSLAPTGLSHTSALSNSGPP